MYRRWVTYEKCDHRILAPGCFPHIKSRFLHLNLSSKSENITSGFFIGLWRSYTCHGRAITGTRATVGDVRPASIVLRVGGTVSAPRPRVA